MTNDTFAKANLEGLYGQHLELFPSSFAQDYARYV